MDPLSRALEAVGYTTANLDYPSRKFPVEHLAMAFIPMGLSNCRNKGAKIIDFVTHSLGGILVRYYLSKQSIQELGRVVMLSPPNQGSEVADTLKSNPIYRWHNGPAGQQLGTRSNSLVTRLGPVDYPVGIITGNKHAWFDAWFADMIPGPNDGKVSVKSATAEGMKDFLVLPYSHPFIMKRQEVIEQVIRFLKNGMFHH